jgi:exodeoxyribonuclease-3
MLVATWNVNSIRARLERLLAWLDVRRPDVVLLQETKCLDEAFPREPIEDLGYEIAFHGQRTYNGVAILARGTIEDVVRGFGDERFDGESRVIGAAVGDLLLVSVYVVNGQAVGHPRYDYKLDWLGRLARFLKERYPLDEKVIVGGDFNVTFDDRDVHDPLRWREKILCSTPEREALRAVVEAGYADALRAFNDQGGIYTWWDFYTRGFERGNKGLRIDHLLMSPPALAACTSVCVDVEVRAGPRPSDHAPVVATLR